MNASRFGRRWGCLALLAALAAGWAPRPVGAEVVLPAVISDHMVLQQGVPAPLWGWADADEEVRVTVAGQTHAVRAGSDGRWQVALRPLPAGGPHEIEIAGTNRIVVRDVLVGEVWLGSGQSNMAMTVSRCQDFDKERSAADLPSLRMFIEQSASRGLEDPQQDPRDRLRGRGQWHVCSPETVGSFSGTLYFLGRALQRELDAPVGLINSSVGGTPIELWIRAEAQAAVPELSAVTAAEPQPSAEQQAEERAQFEQDLAAWAEAVRAARAAGKPLPRRPQDPAETRARKSGNGRLYEAKIRPLVPYAVRGVVWYQGEANSVLDKAPLYRLQLPLLVEDWRRQWGQPELPFAWVQLPNYGAPSAQRSFPLIREAMLQSLRVPRTGMAIAIDVGDPRDIHPKNKQAVGERLAGWALAEVYGKPQEWSGPLPADHKVEGAAIRVEFTHAEGLRVRGGTLAGFEIAGTDRTWHPATARIEGTSVVVSSDAVREPVAVRYGWANDPPVSLENGAGLPASPFRTDDWPE